MGFAALLKEVRACTLHEKDLPLGPRLTISIHPGAHIINSYVPGNKVHETGIAWNDPSGERLLDWTLMNGNIFYDAYRIDIMPMGFCCPGRLARGGVTKSAHLSRLALSSRQCCAFFSPLCARQFPGWRCIYLRRKSRDCPTRSKRPALR